MKTLCLTFLVTIPLLQAQMLHPTAPKANLQLRALRLNESAGSSDKSPVLAAALSIILPGAGELYAGNSTAAQYFLAIDATLWLAFTGFSLQSTWVMDDARLYARDRAGADFAGKDEQFEAQLGNYMSRDDYNLARLRDRRFSELFLGPAYDWKWEATEDRLRYRKMRIRSGELTQAAEFVVGALVVNRIISTFSAWRSAKSHNEAVESDWHLGAGLQHTIPHTVGVGIQLTRSF
jgi:hypothetical protein